MRKRIVTPLAMALFLSAICPIRTEAATTLTDLKSEEQHKIFIRVVHMELTECTYEDGEMVETNPREVIVPYYIVNKEGETIETIAKRLQLTEEHLLSENSDYDYDIDEPIQVYSHIALPQVDWRVLKDVYYIVEEGDSLSEISKYFYITVTDIQELNPKIKDPDVIYAGDIIKIK